MPLFLLPRRVREERSQQLVGLQTCKQFNSGRGLLWEWEAHVRSSQKEDGGSAQRHGLKTEYFLCKQDVELREARRSQKWHLGWQLPSCTLFQFRKELLGCLNAMSDPLAGQCGGRAIGADLYLLPCPCSPGVDFLPSGFSKQSHKSKAGQITWHLCLGGAEKQGFGVLRRRWIFFAPSKKQHLKPSLRS